LVVLIKSNRVYSITCWRLRYLISFIPPVWLESIPISLCKTATPREAVTPALPALSAGPPAPPDRLFTSYTSQHVSPLGLATASTSQPACLPNLGTLFDSLPAFRYSLPTSALSLSATTPSLPTSSASQPANTQLSSTSPSCLPNVSNSPTTPLLSLSSRLSSLATTPTNLPLASAVALAESSQDDLLFKYYKSWPRRLGPRGQPCSYSLQNLEEVFASLNKLLGSKLGKRQATN